MIGDFRTASLDFDVCKREAGHFNQIAYQKSAQIWQLLLTKLLLLESQSVNDYSAIQDIFSNLNSSPSNLFYALRLLAIIDLCIPQKSTLLAGIINGAMQSIKNDKFFAAFFAVNAALMAKNERKLRLASFKLFKASKLYLDEGLQKVSRIFHVVPVLTILGSN